VGCAVLAVSVSFLPETPRSTSSYNSAIPTKRSLVPTVDRTQLGAEDQGIWLRSVRGRIRRELPSRTIPPSTVEKSPDIKRDKTRDHFRHLVVRRVLSRRAATVVGGTSDAATERTHFFRRDFKEFSRFVLECGRDRYAVLSERCAYVLWELIVPQRWQINDRSHLLYARGYTR
jgi:hypothetical protein